MIGRPIKALDIVTLVVSDFFLVYTRPAFLAVPVAYYICVLIVYLVKKARLEVIKIISCAIVFALVLVGYCTINYFKTGIFEVSIISDINFLGKELQYGLVGGDSSNQTSVIQDISGYGVRGEKNPYTIINNVFPDYNYDFQQIRSANKYFLKGNKLVFLTDSIGLVPRIMSAPRQFYVAPNSTYAYAYSKYDIIYGVLNLINLYTVILATLLAIYLLIKRQANALPIIIILLSIFASVMTISGTAYSEYVRMKAPLQPLLQIMFVICVWGVFNLRKIRKI